MTARSVQAALSATPGEPIGVSVTGNTPSHWTLMLGEPGHGLMVTGTEEEVAGAIDDAKEQADQLREQWAKPRHFSEGPTLADHRGLRSDD